MQYEHKTVLLNETVDSIDVKNGKLYVDATFGGGGHSRLILSKADDIRLFVFDQDIEAIENGKLNFVEEKRINFINDNFVNIKKNLQALGIKKVDGIIADLGVSSYQLDNADRGFSYMSDAKLDMRMDKNSSLTAEYVVNTYSKERLKHIIREYGQENWSDRIAEIIVEKRAVKPITTTLELVDIIEKSIPKKLRDKHKHPAKRTFQAIRIEVNNEIDIIEKFIQDSFDMMNIGGRIAIITFHSLEDRAVKNSFKELSIDCVCPKEFPVCMCNTIQKAKILTKKPILPTDEEINSNPRSRSAKLRVLEKINEGDEKDKR